MTSQRTRSAVRIAIAAGVGVGVGVATFGLAVGVSAPAADAAGRLPTRSGIVVHAHGSGRVSAPSDVTPGATLVRNTGTATLYLIGRRRAGATRLASELAAADRRGPGQLAHDYTLLDVLRAHSNVTLDLTRGTYYLANADARHLTRQDITVVSVHGRHRRATLPTARPVTMDVHGTLHVPAAARHGSSIRLSNRTGDVVELLTFRPGPGVKARATSGFLHNPTLAGIAALAPRRIEITGVVARGHDLVVPGPASPGRYVVLALRFGRVTVRPILGPGAARLLTVG